MRRMSAVAHRAESVQSWHADSTGKVAVGAASDRDFLQRKSQSVCDFLRRLKKGDDLLGSLQRRPVNAALELQFAIAIDRPQRLDLALHARSIGLVGDAEIDFRYGFAGDYVGARARESHRHSE